jgi:hypothetical protein
MLGDSAYLTRLRIEQTILGKTQATTDTGINANRKNSFQTFLSSHICHPTHFIH